MKPIRIAIWTWLEHRRWVCVFYCKIESSMDIFAGAAFSIQRVTQIPISAVTGEKVIFVHTRWATRLYIRSIKCSLCWLLPEKKSLTRCICIYHVFWLRCSVCPSYCITSAESCGCAPPFIAQRRSICWWNCVAPPSCPFLSILRKCGALVCAFAWRFPPTRPQLHSNYSASHQLQILQDWIRVSSS